MKPFDIFSKSMRRTAYLGAAGLLALSVALPVSAADLRLKFAGTLPVDHQGTKMMEQIKADIEGADVGLKVSVFPANQLGSGEELFEDAIRGNIDFVNGFIYSHKDPTFEINSMPFLVSNWDQMDKIVRNPDSAFNQIMSERLDNLGLILLNNNPEGFVGIVAEKKPEDWDGLGSKDMNIRVWSSNVVKETVESLGYNATTLAWAEIFPALQSGIVDGAICCTKQATYTVFAVSDVGKYFVGYDAFMEIASYYGSKKTWAKMNDEQRAVVKAAFDKASNDFFEWNKANDAQFATKLEEKGYEILVPTDEQKQAMAEHVRSTIWPQMEESIGKDVIDRIRGDLQ